MEFAREHEWMGDKFLNDTLLKNTPDAKGMDQKLSQASFVV